MKPILKFLSVLALISAAQAESCSNPKVDARAYTPDDAQVLSHIAFIAEFTLTCSNSASNVNLYAEVEGTLAPVIKVQDGSNKYQISWTKELKQAKTGDVQVRLFDEEGYGNVKRATERGDDAGSVKPLVTISVNYPGAYKGPIVNSELIAGILAFLVFYVAYSSKVALLA